MTSNTHKVLLLNKLNNLNKRRSFKKSRYYKRVILLTILCIFIISIILVSIFLSQYQENSKNTLNPTNNITTTNETNIKNQIEIKQNIPNIFSINNFTNIYKEKVTNEISNTYLIPKEFVFNDLKQSKLFTSQKLIKIITFIDSFRIEHGKVDVLSSVNNTQTNINGARTTKSIYPSIIMLYFMVAYSYNFINDNTQFINIKNNEDFNKDITIKESILNINYAIVYHVITPITVNFIEYFEREKELKTKLENKVNNNRKLQKLGKRIFKLLYKKSEKLFSVNKVNNLLVIKNVKNLQEFFQILLFHLHLYIFDINEENEELIIGLNDDFKTTVSYLLKVSEKDFINNKNNGLKFNEIEYICSNIFNLFKKEQSGSGYDWNINNNDCVRKIDEFITSK